MSLVEWTLWILGSGISLLALVFTYYQYFNVRGGHKTRVVYRSIVTTMAIFIPVWLAGYICCFQGIDSSIALKFGSVDLETNPKLNVIYGIPVYTNPVSAVIPLYIENKGDSTIEDVSISFSYSGTFIASWPTEATKPRTVGGPANDRFSRETSNYDDFHSSTITIKKINPGENIYVGEPFVWTSKYIFQLERMVNPSVDILITLSGKDRPQKKYNLKVFAVKAESSEEVAQSLNSKFNTLKISGDKIIAVTSPYSLVSEEDIKLYISDGLRTRTTVLSR